MEYIISRISVELRTWTTLRNKRCNLDVWFPIFLIHVCYDISKFLPRTSETLSSVFSLGSVFLFMSNTASPSSGLCLFYIVNVILASIGWIYGKYWYFKLPDEPRQCNPSVRTMSLSGNGKGCDVCIAWIPVQMYFVLTINTKNYLKKVFK